MSIEKIVLVCLAVWVVLAVPVSILALALCKAAAPRNPVERARADVEQMKALGYFDNTITSGCPVIKE